MNAEISFLHIGSKYSFLLIKSGNFHFTGSDRAIVLIGMKGSNRITLMYNFVITLIFTVVRASAKIAPSLCHQSSIDFTLAITDVLMYFRGTKSGEATLRSHYNFTPPEVWS